MSSTTAATRWRWRRAGSTSNRTSGPVLLRSWPGNSRVKISFQAAAAGAAAFSQGGGGRNDSTNYPLLWKSWGTFLKNRQDFGKCSGLFWKKCRWCGSFTNCSQETHNSVKIIGYCIIKQRVLPTRCIFSLLKHTQQKGPPSAVLFVPSPLPRREGFCVWFLVRGEKAVYNNG